MTFVSTLLHQRKSHKMLFFRVTGNKSAMEGIVGGPKLFWVPTTRPMPLKPTLATSAGAFQDPWPRAAMNPVLVDMGSSVRLPV